MNNLWHINYISSLTSVLIIFGVTAIYVLIIWFGRKKDKKSYESKTEEDGYLVSRITMEKYDPDLVENLEISESDTEPILTDEFIEENFPFHEIEYKKGEHFLRRKGCVYLNNDQSHLMKKLESSELMIGYDDWHYSCILEIAKGQNIVFLSVDYRTSSGRFSEYQIALMIDNAGSLSMRQQQLLEEVVANDGIRTYNNPPDIIIKLDYLCNSEDVKTFYSILKNEA
jgi:hypothetical protein